MPTAMRSKRSATGASSRRQRVPPALTRGPERFEGLPVLDEIKGDLGLVLWRSVRNILLWAGTPAERRGALFSGPAAAMRIDDLAAAHPEPELLAPLSVIVSLLEHPGTAGLLRVVNACRRISMWAEQRGALGTALEFTQAAAIAAPESASLAFGVGRLSRRRAEYDRAESWYARAVILGRQAKDWKSYALAFSGMGNLHVQRGNYPAARRAQLRCLRASRRHGLRAIEAGAYHDLFAVSVEMGAGFEADDLAQRAFGSYGPEHPMVPRLAYDVAYNWALQGNFAGALRVAKALLAHFTSPSERALVLGLAARAAGGVRDVDSFAATAAQAVSLTASDSARDSAARTLLGLAHGALSLDRWEAADGWAGQALHIATGRKEGRVSIEAEAVLDHARKQARAAEVRQGPPASDQLADSFVEALTSTTVLAAV
jgi:tetratricopeptide (TPR) repeat protein